MIGLANGAAVSRMSPRPRNGNSTSGSSAVTGIGIDSAIQKMAIRLPAPTVRQPCTLSPSGGGASSVSSSMPGPSTQPVHWRTE